ncbi:hypothetical protein GCM10007028_36100 [Algibacter mikhailovii]|uniref:Uncharacterized protein n=2 Tax=Algibacter mikhailovii TaxID=425498 RepID=A0A918VGG1_9FLAO|nr:hypothetical protein GCM10007028_36100 [Algibacter mikhailovii]
MLTTLSSCVEICLEKGLGQASISSEKSKEHDLFKFQFGNAQDKLTVEGVGVIEIKEVWVEQAWTRKCIENESVVEKKDFDQIVLQLNIPKEFKDSSEYFLYVSNPQTNGYGLSNPYFKVKYENQDSLFVFIENYYGEKLDSTYILKK